MVVPPAAGPLPTMATPASPAIAPPIPTPPSAIRSRSGFVKGRCIRGSTPAIATEIEVRNRALVEAGLPAARAGFEQLGSCPSCSACSQCQKQHAEEQPAVCRRPSRERGGQILWPCGLRHLWAGTSVRSQHVNPFSWAGTTHCGPSHLQ